MIKLLSMFAYSFDTERYDNDKKVISEFLLKNEFQGIELMAPLYMDENIIPKEMVKGVHLANYPAWIDLWTGNHEKLLQSLRSEERIQSFYGGTDRNVMIKKYRDEIRAAEKIGAKYGVFHIGHVDLEDIFNYEFTYSDEEVVEKSIELLNKIFRDFQTDIMILLENLWWPGMTLRKKDLVRKLIDGIEYKNVGIMLDTGHLMNTNFELRSEEEGVKFVIDTIEDLGELKEYIKGIHFHCSLSGEYTKNMLLESKELNYKDMDFNEMESLVYDRLMKIDWHKPFTEKCAKDIIDYVQPKYLVYEFVTDSLEKLQAYIDKQNESIN